MRRPGVCAPPAGRDASRGPAPGDPTVLPDRPIPTVNKVQGSLPAPPSKSATQRCLIAAALATGRSRLCHPLLADDSRHLIASLNAVGIAARLSGPEDAPVVEVEGHGGRVPAAGAGVSVGNARTAVGVLAARVGLGGGGGPLGGGRRRGERPRT